MSATLPSALSPRPLNAMIPFRDNIPSRRYSFVTAGLILANAVTFLYELSLSPEDLRALIDTSGVTPTRLSMTGQGPVENVGVFVASSLSGMFLHGGWFHLIGNMWYLWIFGDNVEDRIGHLRFLIFYLLCGALASLSHILFNLGSSVPSVGASGAVAGVLGAYLISYPFARVLTLVPLFLIWPVVELPAVLVLGFWFLVQLLNGTASVAVASETAGGIAWWAHIRGFLAGIVLIMMLAKAPERRYYWE